MSTDPSTEQTTEPAMARVTAYILVPVADLEPYEDSEVQEAIIARLDECYPTDRDGAEGCLVLRCLGVDIESDD